MPRRTQVGSVRMRSDRPTLVVEQEFDYLGRQECATRSSTWTSRRTPRSWTVGAGLVGVVGAGHLV